MDNTTTSSTGDKSKLVLDTKKDFTSSALVDFLNQTHGKKKTGQSFTSGDIQQYLRRGFLPKLYGHHPLSSIKNEKIGVNLIRVDFDKTVAKKTK